MSGPIKATGCKYLEDTTQLREAYYIAQASARTQMYLLSVPLLS